MREFFVTFDTFPEHHAALAHILKCGLKQSGLKLTQKGILANFGFG
jgi:S-adenosylmethionine/arginine decarboxylase-like enzyme